MNDRRISAMTEKQKDENRLKHIAGLIQKLTYTEMHTLSDLLQKHEATAENEGYPEALLRVAEEILRAE